MYDLTAPADSVLTHPQQALDLLGEAHTQLTNPRSGLVIAGDPLIVDTWPSWVGI